MTISPAQTALNNEINNWRENGLALNLFLRDDDAVEPSPQLEQLSQFSSRWNIPVLLAIIPLPAKIEIAEKLLRQIHWTPAVHGYSHINYAAENEKKQELGNHREINEVVQELTAGHTKLNEWFGFELSKIFVPPWNRLTPEIANKLPEIGFSAISAFGQCTFGEDIKTINTHVDIIDWQNSGKGKSTELVFDEITKVLQWARTSNYEMPIGILTHHLVHDAQCWDCLDALLRSLRVYDFVRWVKPDDFI